MKKVVFAALAVAMVLALAGCRDDKKAANTSSDKKSEKSVSDKDVKNFVPADNPGDEIQGIYSCDVDKFMKKTSGLLGKTDKKFNNWGDKEDVLGIQLEIPSEYKKIYIELNKSICGIIFKKNNEPVDEAIKTCKVYDWGFNYNEKNEKLNEIYFWDTKNAFLGVYGTINGEEVIYNEEDKIVFTKEKVNDISELFNNL